MKARAGLIIATAVGVLLAAGLAVETGLPSILDAFARLGWQGLLLVVALHAAALVVSAWGWQVLVRSVGLGGCLVARLVRDGTLILVWMVPGLGILAGIRTLQAFGVPTATAAACAFIDIAIEGATLIVFAILGLLILLGQGGDDHQALWLAALSLASLQIGLIVLLPRHRGAMRLAGKLVRHAARRFGRSAAAGCQDLIVALASLYADRRRMALSVLSHLVAWGLCAAQIWVAAHAMGVELSPLGALAIQGLVFAATGILVMVPWGIGVQEGAFVLACAQFGIDEPTALALSLSVRARDLIIGAPGVLLWLALEGRETLARTRLAAADPEPASPGTA